MVWGFMCSNLIVLGSSFDFRESSDFKLFGLSQFFRFEEFKLVFVTAKYLGAESDLFCSQS